MNYGTPPAPASSRIVQEAMMNQLKQQAQANQYAGNAGCDVPRLQGEPDSASLIRDEMGRCEELVVALHEEVSGLERRLETILAPAIPNASMQQPNPVGGSDVLHRVTGLTMSARALGQRLHDVLLRIEL